jgi:hypothetical protein
MTELTWTDKQSGATRYGAEIVAQTLDYQGANEDDTQVVQPAAQATAPQPAEPVAADASPVPAKPKRSRSKKAQAAAA